MSENGLRALLLSGMVLAAGGCRVFPDPPPMLQAFDLGPLKESSAASAITGCLTLDRVAAPPWMDGTSIHYRLLYDQPQAYRTYAHHVWVAPPPELVAQRLDRLLFAAECGSIPGSRRLHLRLVSFEQVFETPARAYGEVRLHATLTQAPDQPPMRRAFTGRRDSRPEVHGAVETLPALVDELLAELGAWLEDQARQSIYPRSRQPQGAHWPEFPEGKSSTY